MSDKLGYAVELAHEYEWEVAARYPDSRLFPWGNDFDSANANTSIGNNVGQTTAVGIYPQGQNVALGLEDMSGNVWEWCHNKYDNPDETQVDDSGDRRVVRGGSWHFNQGSARAAYRAYPHPTERGGSGGFRVVRRPPSHDH